MYVHAACVFILVVIWTIQSMRLRNQRACVKPRVISNFLTPKECRDVIQAALRKGLERSEVGINTVSEVRTSDQVFLEHTVPAANAVISKAEKYLGLPRSRFESLQVARYTKGQKYEAHYDSDDETPAEELRSDTLLMYLTDVQSGGHTDFPKAGVRVKPAIGKAVHWKNTDDMGNILPCAYHGGLPVTNGTKWICTVWVN